MARKPSPAAPKEPEDINPFDELLGGVPRERAPEVGEGAGLSPQASPPAPELPPEPLLGAIVEPTPKFAVPAAFSDDPPEGWGTGQGNAGERPQPDPVTSQLDPAEYARASLLEDAARAKGETPKETVPLPAPVPVERQETRVPEIRQALARAAASALVSYRSRIGIAAAWKYDQPLHKAPPFIDRNWLAYDEGPALDIPEVGLVKQGQWIVIQNVLADDGAIDYSELKIYDDAVFTSLFRPVAGGANAEQKQEAGPPDGHGRS